MVVTVACVWLGSMGVAYVLPLPPSELINLCVKGTVDMRALTVVKTGGRKEEAVAREENMTLAVESARAIGCQITESTHSKLLSGDKATCRQIVFDLVKVRLSVSILVVQVLVCPSWLSKC